MQLVQRILERARLEDHVDNRRIACLVDVDHAQVQLAYDPPVLPPQEGEPFGLEGKELVQLIEPPLMKRKVSLEDGQLLRNVSDSTLERSNLARDIRDLGREVSLFCACRAQASLNVAELAAWREQSVGRNRAEGRIRNRPDERRIRELRPVVVDRLRRELDRSVRRI